jgi:outer membrane protein
MDKMRRRGLSRAVFQGRESDLHGISGVVRTIDGSAAVVIRELIDLAESHNPETRVAWENARAQAASVGIARSELLPTLSALP